MSGNKNKMYSATKRRHIKRTILLGSVILIYAFFFTSRLTMPQTLSEATAVGVPLTYTSDRGVIIYDAIYDNEAELMEVVLNFSNSSNDSVNSFYFFADATGRRNYDNLGVEVIYEDPLITVIRLPIKKFNEVKIIFAPKLSENLEEIPNNVVGTMIFNRDNLKYGHIDTEKSREDYLVYRYKSTVDLLEAAISESETKLNQLEKRKEALKNENIELEENMQYFTDDEKNAAKRKIEANNSTREDINESLLAVKNKIASLEEKYSEALSLYNKNFKQEQGEKGGLDE